jgi:glycosyltransferase involved in cell wall biosynthesis
VSQRSLPDSDAPASSLSASDAPHGASTRRQRSQIIFIGEYRFPEGDAAAIRTLSLARICRDLGFAVTVIGKGQLRPEDYRRELDVYEIDGIRYSTMNPERVTAMQRLRHPMARLKLYASALEAMNLADTRAIVINACSSATHVPLVRAFCRRRQIPLIGDICEWYDPCQMTYGRLDPAYAVFCGVFRYALPRFKNLIVVSRLLERHFAGEGRHVLRIPAVLDPRLIACVDRTPADRLVLLYAGIPGRKDHLEEILEALAALSPDERARVEFRLLGPTEPELRGLLGGAARLLDALADTVKPLGRVPRAQVLEQLQQAHFTVLVRPDKRYANAGFPSKVSESLAAGVPVLLTMTSDLQEFLGDGVAAIPVRDCSVAAVTTSIRRALQLNPEALRELRRGARAKAEQYFDYRLHLRSFADLIEQSC